MTDQRRLVFGPQIGMHRIDPHLAGQGLGGRLVVAGEHGDLIAAAAQVFDDLGGFGPQFVAHRDRPNDLTVVFDQHGGGAGGLHGRDVFGQGSGVEPAGAPEP